MINRKARAVWQGNLREGQGSLALGSGACEGQYSFSSRFENGQGTNPEELIGAAHAGCFSMALSGELTKAGYAVQEITTEATVSMEKDETGLLIKKIKLMTRARVRDISMVEFARYAAQAKNNCPVSRALSSVDIQLEAHLLK